MDWLQALVLGIVQGATEYLPISSSAHLAIVPWALGWQKPSFAFDILVQLGTLVGVVAYYRADLMAVIRGVVDGLKQRKPFATPEARMGWYVVVATIPAVVIGLLIKDIVEEAWGSARQVFIELGITGLILFVAEVVAKKRRMGAEVDLKRSIWIGFAQAAAIMPGISRSGATIAGAMLTGVDRPKAASFSFVMSIPVMLGAGVLGVDDLLQKKETLPQEATAIAIGFVAAAISGYLVIKWFLRFLKDRSLAWFGAYCLVVATIGLMFV